MSYHIDLSFKAVESREEAMDLGFGSPEWLLSRPTRTS